MLLRRTNRIGLTCFLVLAAGILFLARPGGALAQKAGPASVNAPAPDISTASTAPPDGIAMPIALKDCVILSLKKSPAVDSSNLAIEGADWGKKKAFTGFLPSAEVNYNVTHLDNIPRSSGTKVGSQDIWELQLTVTQPIFTGFKILTTYKIAELGLDVARITRVQTMMDLVLSVKSAYFKLLQAEKALEVSEQSVKQLQEHLDVAQSFYDVGMEPKNHVLEAEVKLAEAVQLKLVAQHGINLGRANLNTLLRREMDAPLTLRDALAHTPYHKTLEECLAAALDQRPEMANAKKNIELSEKSVTLARSDYYPTVAAAYVNQKKSESAFLKEDKFNEPNQWYLYGEATWTFEWGRTFDSVQIAKVDLSKAKNVLTQVTDGIKLEVKQSYLDLEAADKVLVVTSKAVEQAEESFRMSTERYKEQVATATEVTDAETLLTSARYNYYNALANYNIATAALERAMGLAVE
ncbi:MAG: TolC family protein [Pseudomonadota bacterium]